jgi:DNA-directed RNA polymerase specialized sigma subunit, sigma54 homolog
MSLSQSLQQKLLQKLSPQQIQLMKLLQVPTANLEERIKEELEENPALELNDDDEKDFDEPRDEFENNEDDFDLDGSEDEYENIDISEYVNDGDDEMPDYKMRDENYPEENESKVIPLKNEVSFYSTLLDQLGLLSLEEHQYKIAEQVVGSLDDDGYLRREVGSIVDDLAFRQDITTNEKEVEKIMDSVREEDQLEAVMGLARKAKTSADERNKVMLSDMLQAGDLSSEDFLFIKKEDFLWEDSMNG